MSPPSALTSLVVLMMLCSGGVAFSPSLPPALPRSLPPTLSLHQPSTLRLSPLSRAGVSLRPQRRAQFPLMAEPSPDVAFQHAMQGDDWKMNAGGNVPGCNGDGAYISQGREMQRRSVLQGAAMLPFVLAGFSEKASAKEGDLGRLDSMLLASCSAAATGLHPHVLPSLYSSHADALHGDRVRGVTRYKEQATQVAFLPFLLPILGASALNHPQSSSCPS
eukprot:714706-Rhodomonas_salina.1